MSEKWFPVTSADYVDGFNGCLPQGDAWPRDPDSSMQKVITGITKAWGDVVEPLSSLLLTQESDPRSTVVLLPEWERAWGLPDECLIDVSLAIPDRQVALVTKMTLLGAQSRAFFVAQAAKIGYTIQIREWSPFMCGISRCGDTRNLDVLGNYRWEIGPPEMRFYWSVQVQALRFTWFRCGSGQCGIDPLLRIAGAEDLECMLRRWKPAHTEVLFDFSTLSDLLLEESEIVTLVM